MTRIVESGNTVTNNIMQSGQHLFGIFGVPEKFVYTVGNHLLKLPELLIIGNFPTAVMAECLNIIGLKQREKMVAFPEGFLEIGWQVPMKLRKCGPRARSDYTIQAGQYLETEDYEVMQVMFCDKQYRYPDEPGCVEPYKVDMP